MWDTNQICKGVTKDLSVEMSPLFVPCLLMIKGKPEDLVSPSIPFFFSNSFNSNEVSLTSFENFQISLCFTEDLLQAQHMRILEKGHRKWNWKIGLLWCNIFSYQCSFLVICTFHEILKDFYMIRFQNCFAPK